jgi:hypothetical protein
VTNSTSRPTAQRNLHALHVAIGETTVVDLVVCTSLPEIVTKTQDRDLARETLTSLVIPRLENSK